MTTRISLSDNSKSKPFERHSVGDLFGIADKSIKALCEENEHLLVFPHCLDDAPDKIKDDVILSMVNGGDMDHVRIQTGNIMGFVGNGGLRVKIGSRFDEEKNDFFMHHMLQTVLHYNMFDMSHGREDEQMFDFLVLLFPRFLHAALSQGVYREYRRFEHNDARISGPINIARHIKLNIPFMGKVAYDTRNYTEDNSMTQLVRHTIEYIRTKRIGRSILNGSREVREDVASIVEVTPTYSQNRRSSVMADNLRMASHPYFSMYRPLQSLCMQILRQENIKYGESDEEVYGVLFDGAWLWEEYVNCVIADLGFKHPQNKIGTKPIHLFTDKSGIRYPDFYREDFVLDAKYKKLEEKDRVSGVDRDDIHQVVTYMHVLKVERGGFVFPATKEKSVGASTLRGYGGSLGLFPLLVPQGVGEYDDFLHEIEKNEKALVESIKEESIEEEN